VWLPAPEGEPMSRIRFKRIALVVIGIVLLCQADRIIEFLKRLNPSGILTLEPLRRSPEEGRFLVTIALCVLVFVVLYSLFQRGK
jgi:hypothetical protein